MNKPWMFLFSLENRLKLYIGEENITAFRHFLCGYVLGLPEQESLKLNADLGAFENYVRKQLGISKDGYDVFTIIQQYTNSDTEAFQLFFQYLHEFYDFIISKE